MDINVKVKLESPELMTAILALVEVLPRVKLEAVKPSEDGQVADVTEKVIKVEEKKHEAKKEEIKIITLEEVRLKLASLSQTGKQKEVKALIVKYGANKLTDLDPTCYEELLKEAEVL